jgi:hypothetical protein
MTVPVAEGNHPSVILQEEIEDRRLKLGIGRPCPETGQIRACRGQELGEYLILGRNPSQGLQGDHLCCLRCHGSCLRSAMISRKRHAHLQVLKDFLTFFTTDCPAEDQ